MTNKLDYNNEAVLQILNNPSYAEEQKKELFEQYKVELKKKRRNEIVSRLNDYARDIPVITKEIYIECLKKYENDDLTKPFEVIEEELKAFEAEMKSKYDLYLKEKETPVVAEEEQEDIALEEIVPDVTPVKTEEVVAEETTNEEIKEDEFDDTMFKNPEEFVEKMEEVTPSLFIKDEISVLNEEPETLAKPLFEKSEEETKEVMPEELPDALDEKGNASAIILSIIAIIIGAVVMYTIIKLK